MVRQGNLVEGKRINTTYLLVKVAFFDRANNIFNIKADVLI
jgi:hypothetical protein